MKLKIIAVLINIFLFFSSVVGAEDVKVKILSGRIIEKNSREPVVYANIGIEGTFIGAASNEEGFFEIRVPGKAEATFLYVSAVGFSKIKLPYEEIINKDFLTIELEKQTYGIEDVDIEAQSRVAYRVLREASKRIPSNYLSKAFSSKAYYNNTIDENGSVRIREAIVELSDQSGYIRETPEKTFKNINYRFTRGSRNFEIKKIEDGNTRMDELLEFDIVRNPLNILEGRYLNSFDLSFEEPEIINNDSVWVISYNLAEPLLCNTGDFYSTSYKGQIFIRKKDYVVLKNKTWATSSAFNRYGRSLAIGVPDKNYNPVEFYYDFETTYKLHGNKYSLDRIVSNRTNKWSNVQGVAQVQVIRSELIVLDVNDKSPKKISSRDYIEDTKTDEAFWSRFTKPTR